MYKLNLMILALLFMLSVVAAAAAPRELKQAQIKRGDNIYQYRDTYPKPKPSKKPQPTTTTHYYPEYTYRA